MHGKTSDLFLRLEVIKETAGSHLPRFLCLVIVFPLLFSGMCRAEVFQYRDDEGVVHFSDSLDDIPKGRQIEEVYDEPKSFDTPEEESLKKEATKEVPGKEAPEAASESATPEKDHSVEALEARRMSLDIERSQLEEELAKVIERGRTQRVTRAIRKVNADLKVVVEALAEHQVKRDAFEKDWEEHHAPLKDSPEVEKFKGRKADLDGERVQLQERLSELAEKNPRQINQRREIRWYKVDLREINQRFSEYRKQRDAFEKDRDAYYAAP